MSWNPNFTGKHTKIVAITRCLVDNKRTNAENKCILFAVNNWEIQFRSNKQTASSAFNYESNFQENQALRKQLSCVVRSMLYISCHKVRFHVIIWPRKKNVCFSSLLIILALMPFNWNIHNGKSSSVFATLFFISLRVSNRNVSDQQQSMTRHACAHTHFLKILNP